MSKVGAGERQGFREARDKLEKRLRDGGMSGDKARRKAVEVARRVDRKKRQE